MRCAEAEDYHSDVLLLIAERKLDGRPIGTMRLQPNFNLPLRVEGEMTLPDSYRGRRLIEAGRLGVESGITGRTVMVSLVKAAYEICHASSVDFAIVAGRRSMAEIFRSMLFDDLLTEGPIPISYAKNVPHWILGMPICDADRRWRTHGHALYSFMARTEHPDIQIDYDRVFRTFGNQQRVA